MTMALERSTEQWSYRSSPLGDHLVVVLRVEFWVSAKMGSSCLGRRERKRAGQQRSSKGRSSGALMGKGPTLGLIFTNISIFWVAGCGFGKSCQKSYSVLTGPSSPPSPLLLLLLTPSVFEVFRAHMNTASPSPRLRMEKPLFPMM